MGEGAKLDFALGRGFVVLPGFFIALHAWWTAVTSVETRSGDVAESTAGDWRRRADIRTVFALVSSFTYCLLFDANGALLSAVLITVLITQITALPLPRGIFTYF